MSQRQPIVEHFLGLQAKMSSNRCDSRGSPKQTMDFGIRHFPVFAFDERFAGGGGISFRGEVEVNDGDCILNEKNMIWLEVAMDQADPMNVPEAEEQLPHAISHLAGRRARGRKHRREVRPAALIPPVGVPGIVHEGVQDSHHVGVFTHLGNNGFLAGLWWPISGC